MLFNFPKCIYSWKVNIKWIKLFEFCHSVRFDWLTGWLTALPGGLTNWLPAWLLHWRYDWMNKWCNCMISFSSLINAVILLWFEFKWSCEQSSQLASQRGFQLREVVAQILELHSVEGCERKRKEMKMRNRNEMDTLFGEHPEKEWN